jgi:hypothetical protein
MLTEIHITVETKDLGKWVMDCVKLQVKPLVIQLTHGANPLQVMCSRTVHMYPDLLAGYLVRLQNSIQQLGYYILRTKVEVPRSDVVESRMAVLYCEAHYSFKADADQWNGIVAYALDHNTPLSFSVLNGKWWATQRWKEGWLSSNPEKPYWLDHYGAKGQSEAVLIDTNPTLDKDWADIKC